MSRPRANNSTSARNKLNSDIDEVRPGKINTLADRSSIIVPTPTAAEPHNSLHREHARFRERTCSCSAKDDRTRARWVASAAKRVKLPLFRSCRKSRQLLG